MTWRGGRGRSALIVLALMLLVIAVAVPGDAQPGARHPARAAGGPGIPPLPADFGQDDQITFDPITPSVTKAKVQFSLRDLTLRTSLFECIVAQGFLYPDPCPIYDTKKLPLPPDDSDFYWAAVRSDSWVVSSPGPNPTYGAFPAVRVHTLAFGSIPVSATVQLTQTVHGKYYDPLRLRLQLPGVVKPGEVAYPGYGRAPSYGAYQTGFVLPLTVTGAVNVRISDVLVDQEPVDVGPACRTVRPAQLKLGAPGGYYPEDNLPGKHRDRPGGFLPLASGNLPDGSLPPAGWLDGTVDIPSFVGCHDGSENLDPLLTGFISGAGNPVSAYANHVLDLWCSSPLAHCPPAAAAEQRAAFALAHLVSGNGSGRQVRSAARQLRTLQRRTAKAALAGPTARR